MKFLSCCILIALLAYFSSAQAQKLNLRPIVGILSQPSHSDPNQQYIIASYVKWMESAGARVVPVLYNQTQAELKALFYSINGLIFTGGSQTLTHGLPFYTSAKFLFDLVVQANQQGDYFPLWGTCQGFQLLHVAGSGADNETKVLERTDAWNYCWPVNFSPLAPKSRLFGSAPANIISTFAKQNVTMNWHHWGVAPDAYTTWPNLNNMYNILATNKDVNGEAFVSAIEGKDMPIYGSQFHPEYTIFEWDPTANCTRTTDAIVAMHYLSDFFVSETRKNFHQFPSVETETKALIYSYTPTNTLATGDMQTYFFE